MSKEIFKKRVLEQKIFEENKDEPLGNAEKFKKKYAGLDIDLRNLYIKIVNYQVKQYGVTLDKYADIPNRDERERLKKKAQLRKWRKLNK